MNTRAACSDSDRTREHKYWSITVETIYLDRMLLSFSMMTRATMQMKKIAYLVFILEFERQTGCLGSRVCHSLSRRGWNFILQRERERFDVYNWVSDF